jgi:hypothetical protein
MRPATFIFLVLFFVVIEACGGADQTDTPDLPATLDPVGQATPAATGPAPTPTATSLPLSPEEEALWDRAVASFAAAEGGSWQAMYEYISPRWQETCEAEEYAARAGTFASLFRGFMELPDDAPIRLWVKDVNITGEEGIVVSGVVSDGKPIEYGEDATRRWVLTDGTWWEEHAAWEVGCVGWKLFE